VHGHVDLAAEQRFFQLFHPQTLPPIDASGTSWCLSAVVLNGTTRVIAAFREVLRHFIGLPESELAAARADADVQVHRRPKIFRIVFRSVSRSVGSSASLSCRIGSGGFC